jgi:ABC-type transport system substrate-binding protein
MRVKFARLVSSRAADCGMNLQLERADFNGGLRSLGDWPNVDPDGKPFDLYLGGFSLGWDPATDRFDPRSIPTKATPTSGDNLSGFDDPRIADLLDRIEVTYDVVARADLLRQYQQILAEQQPELFAWNDRRADGAAVGLRSTAGPLDFDAPMWMAHPERLVLELPAGS